MDAEYTSRCAYCAKLVEGPDVEHVFPKSWYPDGTAPSSMLTVPSHRLCNGQLGVVEERLLRHFALGLDPRNRTARGVQERVFSSMNPYHAKGRNEKDRQKDERVRAGLWKKFKRSTQVVSADESCDALPVMKPHSPYMLQSEAGLWVRGRGVTQFDPADLDRVTEKFVRGVYFHRNKAPLQLSVPVCTPVISEDPWEKALKVIDQTGWLPHVVSPAFIYWGGVATEDVESSLWFFLLWNTYVLCGATGQPFAQDLKPDITTTMLSP